jgi:hypothetical protein
MNRPVMKPVAMLAALALALPLGLGGCFISRKPGTSSASQPSTGHKNHGQARKQEVHERNADRKADKDAAKANKK